MAIHRHTICYSTTNSESARFRTNHLVKPTTYPITAVEPLRLAIIARPRGGDWLCDEIAGLSRDGIDVVVSMLTTQEAEELGLRDQEKECAAARVAFVNVPIPDRAVPPNRDRFLAQVDEVAALLRDGRSIGVHCRASIGRSSVLAASVLVRFGWDAGEAFKALEKARGCSVPDTPEQKKWVVANVLPHHDSR